ncbi:hypothetical protein DKM44_09015 [Deinococcus irradiatisoli]|uniref:Protein kinase domain-containing protein n=1 Tax=Deinococcus irradiatisoli TaxID=2202254 RepID=A0A2Z3JJ12_9DEIO|nr:hypothetical protein [Deinococcus irradiatisoli]AWN23350.1 hypothetical protein DKM44_09015 [Deinococcus irradiatisoli]
MKTVGPFVAARPLGSPPTRSAERGVVTLHALDRLTGMPALVYVLPQAVVLPDLPQTPSLLPYIEMGVQGNQAYVACELPPHASLASDPLQTALGGLRALNALHEAGITHGGVGPYQLWEWDGEVRLGGAGLPWGEPQGALAAPEGGHSPAADLYALGVTLLKMGPLPPGLTDLLSPFAAQRPSARDALARLNAGPPLPQERAPLIVEAPLHARKDPPAPDLTLIADPQARVSARAEPPQTPATQAPSEVQPEAVSDLPVFDWEEVSSGELLQHLEALGTHAAGQPDVIAEPFPVTALGSETVQGAARAPDASVDAELLDFLAAFPAEEQAIQDAPTPVPESVEAETPTAAALPIEAAPESRAEADLPSTPSEASPPELVAESPVIVVSAQRPAVSISPDLPVAPSPAAAEASTERVTEPSLETDGSVPEPPQETTAPGISQAPAAPGPVNSGSGSSSRQLKPVKIGWSQDGSWQVKKGGSGPAPSQVSDAPPPFVRQRAGGPATSKLSPLWVVAAVVVLLLAVLLIRTLGHANRAAATNPACCTVTARLIDKAGQTLSAPITLSVVSVPGASHLSAGTPLGQASSPLRLDAPGLYALKVAGAGYAPQTVKVEVPTTQSLVIRLQ